MSSTSALLEVASTTFVALGVSCALLVLGDILSGRRQRMWIMNVVWPVTALWSGLLGIWLYRRFGRAADDGRASRGGRQAFPVLVAKGTLHCGSGCALGDIAAELVFLAAPIALFGHQLFGAWLYDFIAALALGLAFQYFTIKPMRGLSVAEALRQAIKADVMSLTAWQVGMYGWMALVTFALFGRELRPTSTLFWFMMQIGMLAGFLTSYPVNWWLLKRGIKEAM